MQTTEQSSTKQGIMVTDNAMDPAERRRRLRKVYDILLGLAEQADSAALDAPCDQPQPVD